MHSVQKIKSRNSYSSIIIFHSFDDQQLTHWKKSTSLISVHPSRRRRCAFAQHKLRIFITFAKTQKHLMACRVKTCLDSDNMSSSSKAMKLCNTRMEVIVVHVTLDRNCAYCAVLAAFFFHLFSLLWLLLLHASQLPLHSSYITLCSSPSTSCVRTCVNWFVQRLICTSYLWSCNVFSVFGAFWELCNRKWSMLCLTVSIIMIEMI